ncbi:hypothetical protein CASFOL_000692 [Castilleja foliolosa]|uniref:Uncharacterized protein n=1 Tax=Castilleja foliolosa TaxID=1961234 RepID=A0ABD3EKY9_9LAMI
MNTDGFDTSQALKGGGQTTTVITTEALERLLKFHLQPEPVKEGVNERATPDFSRNTNAPYSLADPIHSDPTQGGQDIRTKKIIVRGTERGGLYYVDDISSKWSVLMVSSQNKSCL